MAEQTTPLVEIDPNQSVKQNIIRLINQTNDTDLDPGDLTIVSIDLVDDQDPAQAEVTVEGVVESGYRGQKTIAYRRVKLSVLQNLIGYYALGHEETFEDVVKKIEAQVGLVPGLLQQKADTPLAIYQRATFELTDPNNALYCHDLSFPVVDDMPHCPYGPQKIIQGDQNLGFYGEIQASELIEPREMIKTLGFQDNINNGVLNSNVGGMDSPWLKLAIDGDVYFTSKYPIVNEVSVAAFFNTFDLENDIDLTIENNSFTIVSPESLKRALVWLVDQGNYTLSDLKAEIPSWLYPYEHVNDSSSLVYRYFGIRILTEDFSTGSTSHYDTAYRSPPSVFEARRAFIDEHGNVTNGWRPLIRFEPGN